MVYLSDMLLEGLVLALCDVLESVQPKEKRPLRNAEDGVKEPPLPTLELPSELAVISVPSLVDITDNIMIVSWTVGSSEMVTTTMGSQLIRGAIL
jgi:hypothetical protein